MARPANDELNKLLQACNFVCRSFGLPELYNRSGLNKPNDSAQDDLSDAFHFSIAWSLTGMGDYASAASIDPASSTQLAHIRASVKIPVTALKLKRGNEVTDIPLKV